MNNNFNGIQSQFNEVNGDINSILGKFYTIPGIKNIPGFNNIVYFDGGRAVGGNINKIPTFVSPYIVAKWSIFYSSGNKLEIYCPKIGGGYAEGLFEGHPNIVSALNLPAFNGVARNMFRNSPLNHFLMNSLKGISDISNICRDAKGFRYVSTSPRPVGLDFFQSTTNMAYAFCNCINLETWDYFQDGQLILNENVNLANTFAGCTKFTINQIVLPKYSDCQYTFRDCVNLNGDVYCYRDNEPYHLLNTFLNCRKLDSRNIHIPSTIPMDISNNVYNFLVNNKTGVNWTGRIYNDL